MTVLGRRAEGVAQEQARRRRRRRGRSGARPTARSTCARDPQNLPAGLADEAVAGHGLRHASAAAISAAATHERAEIYDFVRDQQDRRASSPCRATATASGPAMPAKALAARRSSSRSGSRFITGSISAPGTGRSDRIWSQGASAAAAVRRRAAGRQVRSTINLTLKRGVRSALEYARAATSQARARADQSRQSHRISNSSTWAGTAMRWSPRRRSGRDRVRLHPPPDRARDDARWRAAALSRPAHGGSVEGRRAAGAQAGSDRGRPLAVGLNPSARRAGRPAGRSGAFRDRRRQCPDISAFRAASPSPQQW